MANTRKDYVRAANIVAGIKTGPHAPLCAWQAREAFVQFFSGDNPQFDVNKFREACGEIAKEHACVVDDYSDMELREIYAKYGKIPAIKAYRIRSGANLLDAKNYIETMYGY